MIQFTCPYLNGTVDLTEERQFHIAHRHPDLLPNHLHEIQETLDNPDLVRRSEKFANAHQFSRWFETIRDGKYVVVVVISDYGANERHWIITAYISRKLSGGIIEWQQD